MPAKEKPSGRSFSRHRSLPAAIPTSMSWLSQAVLAAHLLPRESVVPTRLPSASQGRAAEYRRPTLPRFPAPGLRLADILRRTETVAAHARRALAPDEELVVPRYLEVGLVAALTIAALFLRAWNLPDSPVGIHGDETEMAMEALRSIRGESIGIWTGVTLGNPAGYAHWMAVIFRLADANLTTMRLASAIPGVAVIPVGYLLVRSLFPFRVAILTAVLLAVSFWFIIQSRIAFGGITSVSMALLAMWLLIASVQSRRPWLAALAGVALGLGLYTFKTSLFYFTGTWGVALVALALSRDLRRGWEVWLCLGVSMLVGAPMLLFYATSGYIGPNLNDLYSVSLSSPSTWLKIPGLALDAVLLVHQPVQGNTVDGAPALPVLTFAASVFFWAGLAATLPFIKERRNQLLVAAWLIGMAPILMVPGAESRRYLLGLFFVLTFVSIGVNGMLFPLFKRLASHLQEQGSSLQLARRLAFASAVVLFVAFVSLFAAQNLREYGRWSDGVGVRWFFNYEYHQSLLFLKDLPADIPVMYYTVRQPFDSSIRRFELPEARGGDGAEEYGGGGTVPSPGDLQENTIFVFLDKYLPLASELERSHPGAIKIGEASENGTLLFVAYLLPGSSSLSGENKTPLDEDPR